MTEELRLYTWTLYQLSPIQQGIQAGHAAVELAMKSYREQMMLRQGTNWHMYHDWAVNWKTMVLLNGGDLNELHTTYGFFETPNNPFPWAAFYESEESLGGVMTSIAMVVPARIFETVAALRKRVGTMPTDYPDGFTDWELEFIDQLANTGLAR